MLVLASVTDQLWTLASNAVGSLGLGGIFLLMVPESACIPIPSEATMIFAGVNVAHHHYPLWAAVAVGVVANVVGSWIAYAIGYYGRLELVERHGGKLHIKSTDIERAERWFDRWGAWAVFFSRMLPIVRTFISLPAGAARMPFWRFSLFTFLGCVPWVFLLAFVGKQVGDNWHSWRHGLEYADYVILAAIVFGIAYLVVRRRRRRAAAVTS
jgi:membrane protein DedA with SNARE-associated domain